MQHLLPQRAIVGGVSINIAYIRVIPAEELMHIESPAAAVATKLFGSAGGTIIAIGIIISVIGAGNGGVTAAYHFSRMGHEVCLYDSEAFGQQVEAVRAAGPKPLDS